MKQRKSDYSVFVNPRDPYIGGDILAVTTKTNKEFMSQKGKRTRGIWTIIISGTRHRSSNKDILFEEIQVIQDRCHGRKKW